MILQNSFASPLMVPQNDKRFLKDQKLGYQLHFFCCCLAMVLHYYPVDLEKKQNKKNNARLYVFQHHHNVALMLHND